MGLHGAVNVGLCAVWLGAALSDSRAVGGVSVGDTGGMRLETVLLEALTAEDGPVAEECLRWLVEGTAPARSAVDVAWPAAEVH
jgi:hypothetical protein